MAGLMLPPPAGYMGKKFLQLLSWGLNVAQILSLKTAVAWNYRQAPSVSSTMSPLCNLNYTIPKPCTEAVHLNLHWRSKTGTGSTVSATK